MTIPMMTSPVLGRKEVPEKGLSAESQLELVEGAGVAVPVVGVTGAVVGVAVVLLATAPTSDAGTLMLAAPAGKRVDA
jgi:flagellar motor component MotA